MSFIDADCLVPQDYFIAATRVLSETGAVATGSVYQLPPDPAWTETIWHKLHDRKEGYTPDLLGSNLFVLRRCFQEVEGFDETLVTGEDPEFCQRLTARGFRLYNSRSVRVVHLDNPKTIRLFFRQQVWHALGMFGTVRKSGVDKPVVMLALFGASILASMGTVLFCPASPLLRLAIALILFFSVPSAAAAYRFIQIRGVYRPFASVALYTAYFLARLTALPLIVVRTARSATGRVGQGS